jgi:hypothetical protein
MPQLAGSLAAAPHWVWLYGLVMLCWIGYQIHSRKTSLGRLTITSADSPVLFDLIILLKVLGTGLVCWLFWD